MRELLVEKSVYNQQIKQTTKHQINVKLSSLINTYQTMPISFELCPNRNIDNNLLESLKPCFLSITWLLHDGNFDINAIPALLLAENLQNRHNILLHLTGRNLDKHTALLILEKIRNIGIRNLLILQGDPAINNINPSVKQDFPYASTFVQFIREYFHDYFYIAVAGYPDKHPESPDTHQDLIYLKEKVGKGADLIITQASFEYESIGNFANNCRNYSINTPILIGIFIINSYQSLIKMVKFCNLHVTPGIMKIINDNRCNEQAIREYGIDLAVKLIKQSLNNNDLISGVHIFTLNNLNLVKCVLKRLGMIEWWIERPLITDLSKHRFTYNENVDANSL